MLIMIEFNELCPSLLQRFMREGCLPNFRRLYETSTIYTTDAEEEPPNLEPWIQWPTVHSGVPYAEHRIFHLGQGRDYQGKCLAELLSDAGVRVGVMGSMNLNYGPLNGFVVPDPWDKAGTPHPAWLAPFYETVASQVQESSRASAGSKSQLAKFGWFLLRNGLRLGTVRAVLSQLLQERHDSGLKWRRASLLDRLQYDLFRSLTRRLGIQFATFFCNSTAHFQHYFWRNMQPEQFEVPPPATDHPSLAEAILFGYRAMDVLIGRFLADYPADLLMLCTALSQQPWVETTKCTFRPKRFEDLFKLAQIPVADVVVKPVMAEQFHLLCATPGVAEQAEQGLRQLLLDDGQPIMRVERRGQDLFTGCRLTDAKILGRQVRHTDSGATARFDDVFYMIHTMRSGRHHPDGVLWIRNGRHEIMPDKVPLTAIAPTVLAHFGVTIPTAMNSPPLTAPNGIPACAGASV